MVGAGMGSKLGLDLERGWGQAMATKPRWATLGWAGLRLGSRGLPCRLLHMEHVSLAFANEMQADVRQAPTHCFAT